jgi:hypothetical protein
LTYNLNGKAPGAIVFTCTATTTDTTAKYEKQLQAVTVTINVSNLPSIATTVSSTNISLPFDPMDSTTNPMQDPDQLYKDVAIY